VTTQLQLINIIGFPVSISEWHSLIDTGKPRKTCVEVAGRRTSTRNRDMFSDVVCGSVQPLQILRSCSDGIHPVVLWLTSSYLCPTFKHNKFSKFNNAC
jgi:hypothetical protein